MSKTQKEKNLSAEELKEKKSNRKATLVFILFVAIVAPIIWFGMEYLAEESLISQTSINLNGKDIIIKFSEKTKGYTTKDSNTGVRESGTSHYGYFLELVDSTTHTAIQKLKFEAPVHNIPSMPKMVISANNTVWIICTTLSDFDPQDFVLKFSITDKTIKQLEFALDEKYHFREIEGNKLMLSNGTDFYRSYNPVFGGIYFDLDTEKIVDDRK
ncbi:MAG: hypothetical protein ABIP51_21770 [Bacteroidia bacterium]